MLRIDLLENAIASIQEPDINLGEVVMYLQTHEYVDSDIMDCFGGPLNTKSDREYRYVLNAFLMLNRQAMYKLSSEYFVNLSPFIFNENYEIDFVPSRARIDFVDFMRMYTGIYPHGGAAYSMFNRRDPMFPEDLSKIYDKLIALNQMYDLSPNDIINYCYSQTASNASGKLFDLWYDYVLALRSDDGLDIMPDNLLYANNVLRTKMGRKPLIYKLTEYSGGNFAIKRRGNIIVLTAALPFDPEKNQVRFDMCKLWFDKVESVDITSLRNVACDNRSGVAYGKLFFVVDIRVTPNSLVMVDTNDVDVEPKLPGYNSVNNILDIGTTWVPFFEGASRIDINTEALKEIRKNKKLTQEEVATAINVGYRTFQNWEAGKGAPDLATLIRLMYLYDFTDIRRFIEKKRFLDEMDDKFRAGVSLSEIFPPHYDALAKKDDKEGGDL